MKTNFAFDSPVIQRRMTAVEPPRPSRATMTSGDTGLSHLVSSPSAESVPAQDTSIAEDRTAFVVCLSSVGLVKEFVVGAFYERFHSERIDTPGESALQIQWNLYLTKSLIKGTIFHSPAKKK